MNKAVQTVVRVLLILAVGPSVVSASRAQDNPDVINPDVIRLPPPAAHYATTPSSDAMGGSLRVQGDAAAVEVEARGTTIGDVLSRLAAAFNISYRASVTLDDPLNGTYAGSLGHVIARLLDGYDYVIRQQDSNLDITILEKVGEQAVVAPRPHPVSQHRARLRAQRH